MPAPNRSSGTSRSSRPGDGVHREPQQVPPARLVAQQPAHALLVGAPADAWPQALARPWRVPGRRPVDRHAAPARAQPPGDQVPPDGKRRDGQQQQAAGPPASTAMMDVTCCSSTLGPPRNRSWIRCPSPTPTATGGATMTVSSTVPASIRPMNAAVRTSAGGTAPDPPLANGKRLAHRVLLSGSSLADVPKPDVPWPCPASVRAWPPVRSSVPPACPVTRCRQHPKPVVHLGPPRTPLGQAWAADHWMSGGPTDAQVGLPLASVRPTRATRTPCSSALSSTSGGTASSRSLARRNMRNSPGASMVPQLR